MSELTNIFSMLDRYVVSDPICKNHGISCYPVVHKMTNRKQIARIIAIPPTSAQATALMLTGICKDRADVKSYFKDMANRVVQEVEILHSLSELDGFVPFVEHQIADHPNGIGYGICLLGNHYTTLDTVISRRTLTHLEALNCGIDLCSALTTCRRSGYLFVNLKPESVCVDSENMCRIGDLGFISLDSLSYTSIPEQYISAYTPPEIRDAFSALNTTIDVYAVGLILYQIYNNGSLPVDILQPPANADADLSNIILKACAPKPEDRWESPMALGQALINYLQQGDAGNTPISSDEPFYEPDDSAIAYGEDDNGNLNFIRDMEQTADSDIAVLEILTDSPAEPLTEEAKEDEILPATPQAEESAKRKKPIWPWIVGAAAIVSFIIGILLII